MAREKGRNGSATNLYLDDEVKARAAKLAFDEDKSLSQLVEEVLRKRIEKAKANALKRAA